MNPLRPTLVALVFLALAWGKSYPLERVEQDVYLLPNGLVRVVDVRTWRFEGAFREVFLEIDPRPGMCASRRPARWMEAHPGSKRWADTTGNPRRNTVRPATPRDLFG